MLTRWPRYLGPGWLLAYAVSACLWMAIIEVTPVPLVIAFAAAGAIGIVWLGDRIAGGFEMPPPGGRR